ncbi:hypothetical protein BaRGS_00004618, partial [Batillaria attramentaria]
MSECTVVFVHGMSECTVVFVRGMSECTVVFVRGMSECTVVFVRGMSECSVVSVHGMSECSVVFVHGMSECSVVFVRGMSECTVVFVRGMSECSVVSVHGMSECTVVFVHGMSECTVVFVHGMSECTVVSVRGMSECTVVFVRGMSECTVVFVRGMSECTVVFVRGMSECSVVSVHGMSECTVVFVHGMSECSVVSVHGMSECTVVSVHGMSECSVVSVHGMSECTVVFVHGIDVRGRSGHDKYTCTTGIYTTLTTFCMQEQFHSFRHTVLKHDLVSATIGVHLSTSVTCTLAIFNFCLQVEQKGPYVYTEYEIREDVTFSVTQATFRVRRRHVFNPEETAKECVYCQENDTVTVLNTEYLREVYKRGGDTDYLLSKLTSSLRSILHSHSLYSAKVLTSNISALGCLDAVCDTNHGDLSPLLNNVSFGHWLRRVDANYSTVIMENGTRESFNASEIGGVYKALLNVSVLGSELTSQGVDGVTLNSQCLLWARSVCSQLPVPASPASSDTCGIVHLLRECGPDSVKLRGVRDMLDAAFCPQDGDMWCLDLTSLHDSVVSAYFEAFRDFVLVQLVKVVHQYVLVQGNRDLVVTRPQSDLALGYNVTDDVHSPVVWRHVQGVLAEDWVKSEDSEGVLWRVDTCLQDRDMDNNMKIREWNGSQFAPTFILRDPNLQVTLTGHTDFVDACYPLVSCQACAAPAESLTLFVPSLWRAVRYTLTGLTSVLGFDVYRYLLSADTFSWDDKYDVNCGLQALTSTLGFVGWLGLPRLNMEMTAKVGSKKVNCSLEAPHSF